MSITAFAVDQTETGSIAVTMKYNGSSVPGGSLTIYKVGNAEKEDTGYKYTLTEDFAESGAVLETEETADTAKALASYASSNGIKGTTSTIDTYGKVDFNGLEIGVYLIVQNQAASGYEKITPFLVNIPMLLADNETSAISTDNEIYDVEASPKMSRQASSSSSSRSSGGGSSRTTKSTPTPKPSTKSTVTPTGTPVSTNTPKSTGTPETTGIPKSTDTPRTTDTPKSTSTPKFTDEPSSPNGTPPSEVTTQIGEPPDGNGKQEVIITPKTPEDKKTETPKLPQTGQLNWPIPVLVILGLTMFTIGWNLRFGRTRRR